MRFSLGAYGLQGRGRFAGLSLSDVADYAKSAAGTIAADRGVKARVVSEAIRSVTGIAPDVDTKTPGVTWVRLVPAHAAWTEAVFLKATKTDPDARPADFKIDVMPAVTPLLLKRLLPFLLLAGAAAFGAGYMIGRD